MEQITLWSIATNIVQTIVILLGFYFSYKQIRQQALDSEAQTTIEVKKMFGKYLDISIAFRPDGEWENKTQFLGYEWGMIDDYLGFFEHLEYLISKNMLDVDFVKKSHEVKLYNAISHPEVYNKIFNENELWTDLFSLCRRLEIDLDKIGKNIAEDRVAQSEKGVLNIEL